AIALHGSRTTRPTLINGDVRAAHDAGGFVEGNVQLVGHELTERRPGALTAIRLAHRERYGAISMYDDPRIDLMKVDVRVWAGLCGSLRVRGRQQWTGADSCESHGE